MRFNFLFFLKLVYRFVRLIAFYSFLSFSMLNSAGCYNNTHFVSLAVGIGNLFLRLLFASYSLAIVDIFLIHKSSVKITHFVFILEPVTGGTATIAGIGSPFVTCGTANPRDRSRPYFTYPDHHPFEDIALFKKKACGRIPSRWLAVLACPSGLPITGIESGLFDKE